MRILGILFLVLFVITAPVSALMMNLETRTFAIETYRDILSPEAIESTLPDLLTQTIWATASQPGSLLSPLKGVRTEDVKSLLTFVLPPEALKSMSTGLSSQLYDYIQGKSTSVAISLEPLAGGLNTKAGVEGFTRFLENFPKCSLAQLKTLLTTGAFADQDGLFLCNPPGEFHSELGTILFNAFIPTQIQILTQFMPKEVVLLQRTPAEDHLREQVARARNLFQYSWVVPAACLLVASLFAVRSVIGWLGWWGWGLLAAGGLGAGGAWVGGPILSTAVDEALTHKLSGLVATFIPPVFSAMVDTAVRVLMEPIRRAVHTVLTQALASTLHQCLVLGGIGIIMVIMSGVLRGAGGRTDSVPSSAG